MPEYIDREKLLEKVWDADTRIGYVQVVDVGDILDMPIADVTPVVHGHWIMHDDEILGLTCECSNCHMETMGDGNYCGKCGTKMDEEKVWIKESMCKKI